MGSEDSGSFYKFSFEPKPFDFDHWKKLQPRQWNPIVVLAWFGWIAIGFVAIGVSQELANSAIPALILIAVMAVALRQYSKRIDADAYDRYKTSLRPFDLCIGTGGLSIVDGRTSENYGWEDVTNFEKTEEGLKIALNSGKSFKLPIPENDDVENHENYKELIGFVENGRNQVVMGHS